MEAGWLPAKWPKELPIIAGSSLSSSRYFNDGFNLARHIPDDIKKVENNRLKLKEITGLTQKWQWLSQVHSASSIHENAFDGAVIDADASIGHSNVAVVLTADCIPILVCNQSADEFAAIHAGWQGLYKNIIAQTINKMDSNPEQLYIWIGPCIRQADYEVDDGFYQRFIKLNAHYRSYFKKNRPQHYQADLAGIAKNQLLALGIPTCHIKDSQLCSFNDTRFFSHRRDGLLAGRTATFIGIKK